MTTPDLSHMLADVKEIATLRERLEAAEGALQGMVELVTAHGWGEGPALRAARAALAAATPASGQAANGGQQAEGD